MSGVRDRLATRAGVVLLGLVVAGLLLLAGTRTWVVADLPPGPGGGSGGDLPVAGSSAAPLVAALALVGLAGAAALTTLRGAGRVLAGAVLVLAGAGACAAAAAVLADPSSAAQGAVRAATGVSGGAGTPARATAWPVLSLLPALGLLAAGLLVLVSGRRWRTSSRFEAPSAQGGADEGAPVVEPSAGAAAPSRSALWDDLSRGEDPTAGAGGR